MRFKILTLLLALLIPTLTRATVYDTPEAFPNPAKEPTPGLVCNPDGILTSQEAQQLNDRLLALERQTTVEMAVVMVNSIGSADPVELAVDLGTLWGVGKSNSNGVILLIAKESRDVVLQSGYGAEGVLTDALSDAIIRKRIVPELQKGNMYGAAEAAVQSISEIVSDPEATAELQGDRDSALKKKTEENDEYLENLFMLFFSIVFIADACMYVAFARKSRKLRGDWYARSLVWRKALLTMFILGVLSAGMGLIFYLLTLQRYRYWRTRRRKCHQCGAKMRRLNEKEDNAYLTSAQDTEERLGTVDYDVWLCDKCGNVELYPFVKDQEKFTKCPQCGAIAYGVEYERIKVAPTTRHGGIGERVKRCRHCGYTDRHDFNIPKKDPKALGAVAAGAALGALGSRGGGGGFGGGGFGGFGGGSFGGGGASGKW